MNIKLVLRRVRQPIRKLNKGPRIDWGIKLVRLRVREPIRNSLGIVELIEYKTSKA